MIALALIAVGTLLDEVSSSIGKWSVLHKKETLFVMGFLELFWATIFFVGWALYTGTFHLAPASLTIFCIRAVFELIVFTTGLIAITRAERGTFALVTVATIPLVLVVDLVLGYDISLLQIFGICAVAIAFIILFTNQKISKAGIGYVLVWTVGAVATISLFKYNITMYNTVQAEQGFMYLILLAYCLLIIFFYNRTNPFTYLIRYPFSLQSLSRGIATPIMNMIYLFGPASVIVAAKRAFSLMWAIVSGNHYFHEKSLTTKLIAGFFMIVGLVLLAF